MPAQRVLVLAATTALLVAASLGARSIATDLQTPRDLHGASHATSAACARCHPAHDFSWRRTFHRTMTQDARAPGALLGDFDGASITYLGVRATMDRDAHGAPRVTLRDPAGDVVRRAIVERTVGSRRYQQLLARDADVYFRLPIVWSVDDGRFLALHGVFLGADPDEPAAGAHGIPPGFDRHVTRWNDNCIFCHNVAPNPGLDAGRGTFASEVAEFGVACEACHGPGEAHAEANASPARRYALHATGAADPTIVNPARLDAARSAEICGRCHGQRITPRVEDFLAHGDPFVPGDALARYSTPLARDTPLDGDRDVFSDRFWRDGTARLTAYEFQGFLASPCRADARFTCESCHAMHEGDPRGQLRPTARGDAACTQCHDALADPARAAAHGRHDVGVRCVDCHMPRIVYGLVDAHRSHRIESPDPAAHARDARPDACTLCHVDETRAWAIDATARLFAGGAPDARDTGESARASAPFPEIARLLAGGDPIERALAAAALGRVDHVPTHAEPRRTRRLARLLRALDDERFPAIRRIAVRSAARLTPTGAARTLADYDALAPATARRDALARLCALLPAGSCALPPDEDAATSSWRAAAPGRDIVIGE
jgi:predicted CXXCH cytochrome family protein